MSTFVATEAEADEEHIFCAACGRRLVDERTIEYDRRTGKRLETGTIRVCPNRSKAEPHHDLVEILDDEDAEPLAATPEASAQ